MVKPFLSTFDQRAYRQALGQFPTGVAVVTTRALDGRALGLTINSFASVSLEPPLVSWSLRRASVLFEDFQAAPRFTVHVLGAHQRELASQFASACESRFAGVPTSEGIGNIPLLKHYLARFECSNSSCHITGDHGLFIGHVDCFIGARLEEPPLVFCQGRYNALAQPA